MKKFLLGLTCGIALTATTAVYASDKIEAYLSPSKFELNGQSIRVGNEYAVLNYNSHVYVPIRFIAEKLGIGIGYSEREKVISIVDEPATNVDDTTIKVWLIKNRLTPGADASLVKGLLGEPSVETNKRRQSTSSMEI